MLELDVYAYSSFERSGTVLVTVLRVVYAPGGGGGTPLYELYRYVRPQRVCRIFRLFCS